ncbi:hypothetical protein JNB_00255 [Janibacter sp. HTCC2649]|uniref:hypothetical protein n=1 Tax=Janibacter sp. HTCC2649 TaxID=313589 RepID=UPI000066EBFF|nr:hypothetical protein [Janibacter sp. HTCC2649]EAP98553.1 hypothetical protein JNB_00255 [Janibacter sp. HTCC2649]
MARHLTEAELERALSPVREHFFGASVTVNTVLSAHLRAAGLHPSGQTWQMAKYAIDQDGSFENAVAMAGGTSPTTTHADPLTEPVDEVDLTDPADVQIEHVDVYQEIPRAALQTSARERMPTPPLGSDARLQWFPKQFSVGDIDGDGASRLLGTPDLAPVSVLVRETAQNSWDARERGQRLEFTMNLRQLTDSELDVLRERVFLEDAGPLPVASSLDGSPVWALEVSDRGAKGLGGPVRNDLTPPPGEPTNFRDLILTIGTPRDVHLGGGTYGFGKTISYTTSELGTVLFWSRTRTEGGLQHRIIGSAFGSSYDMDGLRYTGRHWWGVIPDDGIRVEPLVGESARVLGENLFERHFEAEETGTSLLILAPVLGGDDREEDAHALVESCLWHLWPKLVKPTSTREHMEISVQLNGVPIPLPDIGTHPILSAFADALSAVRRSQGEDAPEPDLHTEVVPVEMQRPRLTLGHLAITRFPKVEWDAGAREVVPLNEPVSNVALMRHDAELLVKFLSLPKLDSPTLQWCAVFKPLEGTDDAFAMSEPPSHDDWVAEAVKDKAQRQIVNVAMRRIRELVEQALAPAVTEGPEPTSGSSVVALADSLGPLMGPVGGSAPGRRGTTPRGPGAPRQAKVRVSEYLLGALKDGRRRVAVRCHLEAPGATTLEAEVRVGVEGGAAEIDDAARPIGWVRGRPDLDSDTLAISKEGPRLEPGDEIWFLAEVESELLAVVDVRPAREEK